MPKSRIIKAFNTLYFELLLKNSFSDPLTISPLCGNDQEAKELAKLLINKIGFESFDLGNLSMAHLQEPNGPFYNKPLTFLQAEEIWNTIISNN